MPKIQLISIFHSNNSVLAELLRDILNENQIPCYLSQEAVGKEIYPVTIGKLSEIDLLVPVEMVNSAQEIIQAYLSESTQDNPSSSPDQSSDFDLDQ
ncbi:MAG: putative signal transducing protein [Anaerolineales bacterium]